MACCSIVYPRKTQDPCLLCGVVMCARCLGAHFRKHMASLSMHKLANNLIKKPEVHNA